MRKTYTYLLLFITLLGFAACDAVDKEADFVGPYFKLDSFFNQEKQWQLLTKADYEKTITMDGKTVSNTIPYTDTSWILLFKDMDINKPAWVNRYEADTFPGVVLYQAKDSNLRIKSIEINFDEYGDIIEILIIKKEKQPIYYIEQEMLYVRRKYYTIKVKQNATLLGNSEPVIKGTFIKNN